jgi:hypothetical protein
MAFSSLGASETSARRPDIRTQDVGVNPQGMTETLTVSLDHGTLRVFVDDYPHAIAGLIFTTK